MFFLLPSQKFCELITSYQAFLPRTVLQVERRVLLARTLPWRVAPARALLPASRTTSTTLKQTQTGARAISENTA